MCVEHPCPWAPGVHMPLLLRLALELEGLCLSLVQIFGLFKLSSSLLMSKMEMIALLIQGWSSN